MAFREFTDSKGVVWRAWDVSTEVLHPVTRGEDFMGDLRDGWLAFECATERRRMAAPYPSDWTDLSLPALEALCRSAPLAAGRSKSRTPSGEHQAFAAAAADQAAIDEAQRTFTSPRGRLWTVREHECQRPDGERQVVLRFTTADIVVDLPRWPESWREASVAEFALMMLDADPPRRPGKGQMPQRRREDRPREEGPRVAGGMAATQRDGKRTGA